MRRKFENPSALMQYMERKSQRIVKHYRTDWKHYDRPAMMAAAGTHNPEVYVILRECGSYLYRAEELLDTSRDFPVTVMKYYQGDPSAKYFRLNFRECTAESIDPGLPRDVAERRCYYDTLC